MGCCARPWSTTSWSRWRRGTRLQFRHALMRRRRRRPAAGRACGSTRPTPGAGATERNADAADSPGSPRYAAQDGRRRGLGVGGRRPGRRRRRRRGTTRAPWSVGGRARGELAARSTPGRCCRRAATASGDRPPRRAPGRTSCASCPLTQRRCTAAAPGGARHGGGRDQTTNDLQEVTSQALDRCPSSRPARPGQLTAAARVYADHSRTEDAARWARRLAMGRELGPADVVAHAPPRSARLEGLGRRPRVPRRWLERGSPGRCGASSELRGQYNLGNARLRGGASRARALLESTAQRARETGRPWAPYGLGARAVAALVAYVAGDWDDALRMVDVRGSHRPGSPRRRWPRPA